jgi:hypothetical protein
MPVRFEAEIGNVWDLEDVLREHEGEWPLDLDAVFKMTDLEAPSEGWEAACSSYVEQVDWAERMDGWQMLLDTA